MSARLRGVAAHEVKHEDLPVEDKPKKKRIDTLEAEDQAAFLQVLQSIPNAVPKEERKSTPKDEQGIKALRKEASRLAIRHSWATVKVTPDRINGCV